MAPESKWLSRYLSVPAGWGWGLVLAATVAAQTDESFPEWQTSPYVLPYPEGTTYAVIQGNRSGFGHSGFYEYGYDYWMEIGTAVTACRDGVVFAVRDGYANGDIVPGHSNWVKVRHADGLILAYSHLSPGVAVAPGDPIKTGQLLGYSGNTGNTGGTPHLHLHLSSCSEPTDGCGTLPFNFRNTRPNPNGLDSGVSYVDFREQYEALAYAKPTDVSFPAISNALLAAGPISLNAAVTFPGAGVSYEWMAGPARLNDDGTLTPIGTGTVRVRAQFTEESGYEFAQIEQSFEVIAEEDAPPVGHGVINLSTRGRVGVEPLTAGVVIKEGSQRQVVFRAIGPGLAALGLTAVLPDPVLTVYSKELPIYTNDDWEATTATIDTMEAVGAFAIEAGSKDAVIIATLTAGAYTAVVTSGDGEVGTVIVEVYEITEP